MTECLSRAAGRVLAPDRTLRLLPRRPVGADGDTGQPDDLDLGRALLGADDGTYLRIYRPGQTVAFTGRDRLSPGYDAAVQAALGRGFAPALRGPGGRAVAYHEDSLCVEIISNGFDGLRATEQRFVAFGEVFLDALADLGVDAEFGEVPGEFCPGKHSVTVAGRHKLVGTAQRMTARGWMLGAAVVVNRPEPIRDVTTQVYGHLALPFDPATVCAVSDFALDVSPESLSTALLERLRADTDVVEGDWPPVLATRPEPS